MGLSTELISQLAKVINDNKSQPKSDTTVYGTIVEYDGKKYVRIDGSDRLTPVSTTTNIKNDERVTVMIKNHSAVVTGNLTDPSASSATVTDIGVQVSEFQVIVADKVSAKELLAQIARIDTLVSENVTIKGTLSANEAKIETLEAETAKIETLEADNVTINETLTANKATIEQLEADFANLDYASISDLEATNAEVYNLKGTYADFEKATATKFEAVEANIDTLNADIANLDYASISDLEATNANIGTLQAAQGAFEDATAKNFSAINAEIDNLEANKLSVATADITYANIDFSNIGKAAMEYFYATSGLIKDVVVGDATIAGELVGVTIRGDLIEGNTIKAEKLVIKGSDGLYYKLNTDGETVEKEQTEYNSLDGRHILANSITATKISVEDLVAFDATIGGFNISDSSIYSGVKETVSNTTRGIYLDKDGQMAIGDGSNYLKYYKMSDGTYKLEISAASIKLGASGKSVEDAITTVQNDIANISVGGRNLLLNSANWNDFECPLNNTKYGTDYVSVVPGEKITVSYEVKSDTGYTGNIALVEAYEVIGTRTTYKWLTGTTTTEYVKMVSTFTVPEGINYIRFGPRSSEGYVNTFRHIKIERGNIATDWTIAPEDTTDEINTAVDNVSVGSVNLLTNTSQPFERTTTADNVNITQNIGTFSDYYMNTREAGKQITVSFDWETTGSEGQFRLMFNNVPWNTIFLDTTIYPSSTNQSGRFVYTTTLSEDCVSDTATYTGLRIRIDGIEGTTKISNVKCEYGNKATTWSPAPEDLQSDIKNAQNESDKAITRVAEAEAAIELLKDCIEMLVTDESGASLMTQTSTGWTFSTAKIQESLNSASNSIDSLLQSMGSVDSAVGALQQAVSDHGDTLEYVRIGVYEDEPCIELGESDSDYKVLITNTRIMFQVGSDTPTYVDANGLITENITINNELRQGNFAWISRSNGNYGLVYKGGN